MSLPQPPSSNTKPASPNHMGVSQETPPSRKLQLTTRDSLTNSPRFMLTDSPSAMNTPNFNFMSGVSGDRAERERISKVSCSRFDLSQSCVKTRSQRGSITRFPFPYGYKVQCQLQNAENAVSNSSLYLKVYLCKDMPYNPDKADEAVWTHLFTSEAFLLQKETTFDFLLNANELEDETCGLVALRLEIWKVKSPTLERKKMEEVCYFNELKQDSLQKFHFRQRNKLSVKKINLLVMLFLNVDAVSLRDLI